MKFPDDVLKALKPEWFPADWVGPQEWIDRLEVLMRRGCSPRLLSELNATRSVPMLERLEAMTPDQIAELNAVA